jgi:hypothetical protein
MLIFSVSYVFSRKGRSHLVLYKFVAGHRPKQQTLSPPAGNLADADIQRFLCFFQKGSFSLGTVQICRSGDHVAGDPQEIEYPKIDRYDWRPEDVALLQDLADKAPKTSDGKMNWGHVEKEWKKVCDIECRGLSRTQLKNKYRSLMPKGVLPSTRSLQLSTSSSPRHSFQSGLLLIYC